jgi:hypothetical protein
MLTEEKDIVKVAELMETLDQVKKYTAMTRSLKKFALIVGGSIIGFLVILTFFEVYEFDPTLNNPFYFAVAFLLLIIPVIGLFVGGFFMQRQIQSVKEGEWKAQLSGSFSSALKVLLDINWDRTLEEISIGRLGYAIYGFLKTAAYVVVSVSVFEIVWNTLTLLLLQRLVLIGALFWGLFAVLLVLALLQKDLLKRYRELRALDSLVWELRWFSIDLRRAEFQT